MGWKALQFTLQRGEGVCWGFCLARSEKVTMLGAEKLHKKVLYVDLRAQRRSY